MQRIEKESIKDTHDLAPVTESRVPYITYKECRYLYIDDAGEYFVSKDDVTYPLLATFLSEDALNGESGELYTFKDKESIAELVNKKNSPVESTHADFVSAATSNTNGPLLKNDAYYVEEEKKSEERVDVLPEKKAPAKKTTRKKKTQA